MSFFTIRRDRNSSLSLSPLSLRGGTVELALLIPMET